MRDGLDAAITDPLTGLFNRRYAMPHLARIVEAARESGRRFALLIADLDHFKAVNDTYGHAAGDAVLVETARRLRENLRGMDLVARIGGEEFLMAIPRHRPGGGAHRRRPPVRDHARASDRPARRPRDHRDDEHGARHGRPRRAAAAGIGAGAGLSGTLPTLGAAPAGEAEARLLLEAADRALYGAKSDGRAQVKIGRPAA